MRISSTTNINNQYKANVAFAAKNVYVSTLKKTAKNHAPKIDVNAFFSNPEKLELIKTNQRISEEVSRINRENQHGIPIDPSSETPFGPVGGKWPHER